MRVSLGISGISIALFCVAAVSLEQNLDLTLDSSAWIHRRLQQEAGIEAIATINPAELPVLPSGFFREFGEAWQNTTWATANEISLSLGTAYNITDAQILSFNPQFENVLGNQLKLEVLAERDYQFAHEGPVYLPATNEVFFISNRLGNTSSEEQYVELYAINLASLSIRDIPTTIPLANGATAYKDGLAVTAQGLGEEQPGGVAFLDPQTGNWSWIINNWMGLSFNSPNDVVVDREGAIWFTDPPYGYIQGFKPQPQLQACVWRYLPGGGPARMMADGFDRANGLAFSPDYSTLYVGDSGSAQGGNGPLDPERPRTIYAFDVSTKNGSPFISNRRVFALVDYGIPDGLKADTQGNVMASTAEGVSIWNQGGDLLGKVFLNTTSGNLCQVGNDLIILAEKRIFRLSSP